MLTRRTALLLPFLAMSFATARAEPSARALQVIALGRWHGAAEILREDQERAPDDLEISTRLGMMYAQLGFLSDAAVTLSFAQGAEWYEQRALGAHASVLRDLGQLERARDLRAGQILMANDESEEVNAWLSAVDDDLAAGDLDAAVDDGLQALTLRPESSAVHAWLADVYYQRGELDEASFHLWLVSQYGYDVPRAAQVAARIALGDDALVEALDGLKAMRQKRNRSGPLATMQVETFRRMGWLTDAEELLGRDRILYGDRPDYLLALARVHLDLGQREEACQTLRQATATYPQRVDARELWVEHCR